VFPGFTAYPPTVTPTMFVTRVEWPGFDPCAPLEVRPNETAEPPNSAESALSDVVRGE